ncbi:MAG: phosphoribosylformylglycinamidine synthase [bacterium]
MILVLQSNQNKKIFYVLDFKSRENCIEEIDWLFQAIPTSIREGPFIGPLRSMVSPFATNVHEILKNLNIREVQRVEQFQLIDNTGSLSFDRMLQSKYDRLDDTIFRVNEEKKSIEYITDIEAYNCKAGLALSTEEIEYLDDYAKQRGKALTDAELFGFAQANSEHCRHKIFNAHYILDGIPKKESLFDMIKATSHHSGHTIISAYSDNVAFLEGPPIVEFAPTSGIFGIRRIESAISLKAETHNFPTTVCAFPGAATGSGGEIRDRMGGGRGSIPGIGIAGYLTSYARVSDLPWESALSAREYIYQDPITILIQASNGASDYGNKFGQPLIAGTVTTFEYQNMDIFIGWDKVIMLAGGVGHANKSHTKKGSPKKGDRVILLGGDNYRIGIGGGSVSSVNTGEFSSGLELNAVQRSNPEMQQRVYRVIRALVENADNPIISIHDHGAGGHFNCLSELLSESGGKIFMDTLPIGDPTLSDMEILGNESQERMAMVVPSSSVDMILKIAEREQCPCFVIGECTGDGRFIFQHGNGERPVDLDFGFLFGKPPKMDVNVSSVQTEFPPVLIPEEDLETQIGKVLRLTKVASKEWLIHKVDRSVTGLVAQQQTVGPCQLPLSNIAVKSMDYTGKYGIAIGIGDRPIPGIVNTEAGARLSVGEALLNIIWAPLEEGLRSVALSANWMWPAHQPGEDARLYKAVQALSNLCIELGIPVPTGKDSLSMTQKYADGLVVRSPGTVIVTACGLCNDLIGIVTPDIKNNDDTTIAYIPFQELPETPSDFLGSGALAQIYNQLGGGEENVPDITYPRYFKEVFDAVHKLIQEGIILAGHDVSDGGIIIALCEMAFAGNCGLHVHLDKDAFFYEGLGVVIQFHNKDREYIGATIPDKVKMYDIARPDFSTTMIKAVGKHNTINKNILNVDMRKLRRVWQQTSYDMEIRQMDKRVAQEGFKNFDVPMKPFAFPQHFDPHQNSPSTSSQPKIRAAIFREKGTNGDREMAYCLYHAGFEVQDITMTDITSGKETLADINFIVFCGGFSNSDVLGSARGWAGVFHYNSRAKRLLEAFYARHDTLSLGVCNGCQLMTLLNLIYPGYESNKQPRMLHNSSKIFESRFLSVDILESPAILFKDMRGSALGVWVAHAEGRFSLVGEKEEYSIPLVYSGSEYPFNPNGSSFNAAAICSKDGRHVAMMPHLERSIFPWQWGYYPDTWKMSHKITPWIIPFQNAREWIDKQKNLKR